MIFYDATTFRDLQLLAPLKKSGEYQCLCLPGRVVAHQCNNIVPLLNLWYEMVTGTVQKYFFAVSAT
jgi:hypothetical protein